MHCLGGGLRPKCFGQLRHNAKIAAMILQGNNGIVMQKFRKK